MDDLKKKLSQLYSPAAPKGFCERVVKRAEETQRQSPVLIKAGVSMISAAALICAIALSGFSAPITDFFSDISLKQLEFTASINRDVLNLDIPSAIVSLLQNNTPKGE
ncbi:MAG: hypothetical protein ACOYJD_06250 [Christensenellales bacterium]|jgi:hypothetical protein